MQEMHSYASTALYYITTFHVLFHQGRQLHAYFPKSSFTRSYTKRPRSEERQQKIRMDNVIHNVKKHKTYKQSVNKARGRSVWKQLATSLSAHS